MKQLLTGLLVFAATLAATSAHAQALPVRQWQQTHFYRFDPFRPYSVYSGLIRLSPSRLVAVGSLRRGISNIFDSGAGLWWFNNRGDTVRTRLNLQTQTNVSQNYYAADYGYGGMAPLAGGDLLLVGSHSGSTVQGVFTPGRDFIARHDSVGNIRWIRYYLVNGYTTGGGYLFALPDGGAINVCQTAYQGVSTIGATSVLRFDSTGGIVWQRNVGRANSVITATALLPDGTYAVAGYQRRPNQNPGPGLGFAYADAWVFRITAAGDTVGSRYFRVPGSLTYLTDVAASEHGGMLLCGGIRDGAAVQEQGWLLQLDSLGRVQWERRTDPNPGLTQPNYEFYRCHALQGGGGMVLGVKFPPNNLSIPLNGYLAAYRPSGSTAQPAWEIPIVSGQEPFQQSDLTSRGELTLSGVVRVPGNLYEPISLLRLQAAERPYLPNYCQTPPVAYFAAAVPIPTELRVLEASTPGPRYGVLLLWHWDFGDGSSYDGPAPPPHRYATVPAPGTAVTLAVVNNLGCRSVYTTYPWGGPTATQPGRELAARASLWPNPAAAQATLRLSAAPAGPARLELLDVLGRPVRRYLARPVGGTLSQEIDLAGLAPGVYAVRVALADGRTFAKRLVVQP